jgi:hypothetical protein
MHRISVVITSALIAVAPAVSRAQQATDPPAEQPTKQPQPSPAPTPQPARWASTGDGVAISGEARPEVGVKAVPTPPPGTIGIVSEGSGVGGVFRDSDTEAEVWLGANSIGVWGYGVYSGGYFKDSGASGTAILGYGDSGVYAWGNVMGGYFEDFNNSSNRAYIAYERLSGTDAGGAPNDGRYGVYAQGEHSAGYFEDTDNPSYAYVAHEHRGIEAYGSGVGGYFSGTDGVQAYGGNAGGYFYDSDNLTTGYVAYGTSTTFGNGAKNFVQNHPYDADAVIVYAAPEGDEVATYTRGTARLVEGEATVPLGETFKWVTNPDVGLTTYVTPVGEWSDLYVAERTTDQIVVRSAGGAQDTVFDYMVYGLRIGFEESSVVREKEIEAHIPAMTVHRELYARRPDLRRFNSLERFKAMHEAVSTSGELDLTRARALRDAVGEFDPAIHGLPTVRGTEQPADPGVNGPPAVFGAVKGDGRPAHTTRSKPDDDVATGFNASAALIPVDDAGNVYGTSFRPSSGDLASLVELSEPVEPGDVLVIDREHPGVMRRASEATDTGVVGVVAAAPGLVLGTRVPAADRSADPQDEPIPLLQAPAAFAGVVQCKVDAGYGAIWPGDLLVTSSTPGHAMRMDTPLPGTVLGKALEGLHEGTGTIRVLVMLR